MNGHRSTEQIDEKTLEYMIEDKGLSLIIQEMDIKPLKAL